MRRSRPVAARPATLCLVLLLLASAALRAADHGFPVQRCIIALPDSGWVRDPAPPPGKIRILAAVRTPSGDRSAIIFVARLPEKVSIALPALSRAVDSSIRQKGRIIRSTDTTISGIPARKIVAVENRGGSSYILATAANGLLYMVAGYAEHGRAESDPELRAIVESFRFSGTPEIDRDAMIRGTSGSVTTQLIEVIAMIVAVGALGWWGLRWLKTRGL